VYLRGGDAISGNIHADLVETQSLTCIEQCKLVATEEIRGLELLLQVFPSISVYSVPGNHDRTTFKPRAKRYVDLSYDDLTLFSIETHFKARAEKRITFSAPRSGDAYFSVFNTRFLLTHGDRMGSRGGQGFIGPAATIMRGIQKVRQQYARMGRPVDYVIHGHYHVAMDLPNGVSNGALAGFSEYAKTELRAEPETPTQSMFFVHPEWGITSRRRIQVDRRQ
jgi:predicted phosphodiesterase